MKWWRRRLACNMSGLSWMFVCRETQAEKKNSPSQPTCASSQSVCFFCPHLPPPLSLYHPSTPPFCSCCCETNKSRGGLGWGIYACQAKEKASRTTVKRENKGERKGGGKRERLGIPVGERQGGANPLLLSLSQPKTDGRMFWPQRQPIRRREQPLLIGQGHSVGVWLNLKTCSEAGHR